MTSRTDRSIPELFSDAFAQLAKLIGNEFALARAELSGDAMKPTATIQEIERDKAAAREMVR